MDYGFLRALDDAFAPAAGNKDAVQRLNRVAELYVKFGFEHPETPTDELLPAF